MKHGWLGAPCRWSEENSSSVAISLSPTWSVSPLTSPGIMACMGEELGDRLGSAVQRLAPGLSDECLVASDKLLSHIGQF